MTDPLLANYERELAYVRRLGAEFARSYPRVAGNLRIGADGSVEDPHVLRLIEAFAFINARTRLKLEDDFPELTDALLAVLYPHYLAPIPSMAVVQFEVKPELTSSYALPRGTAVETEPIDGEPCRFRTCQDTTLWPIRVEEVRLQGRPMAGPAATRVPGAESSLRIALGCGPDTTTFAALAPDSLRFFLRGQAPHNFGLYELILQGTLEVVVASAPDDRDPIFLGPGALRTVGFSPEEAAVPVPARAFPGYRLLTEYFAFPQRFLFFDVAGLADAARAKGGTRLEIYLYVGRPGGDLEHNVTRESLALGCTPVVNLFRQRAEPIRLGRTEPELRVVPDARRPLALEVHSVDRVVLAAEDGTSREFLPFYSVRHASAREPREGFWIANRRPALRGDAVPDLGTESYLSLVDLAFDPAAPASGVLDVETTCLNRDLPSRLPFGGGQPALTLAEGAGAVHRITCLTAPTRTLRPPLRHGARWRLLSHLTLNHMGITGGAEAGEAIREILMLYDFSDSHETRRTIEGVTSVTATETAGRVRTADGVGIARGTEIRLELDESRFVGSGAYLFALVLERFLGLYAAINSFTRVSVRFRGRDEEAWRWEPRAGDRRLL